MKSSSSVDGNSHAIRVGADIGGTFTDIVVVRSDGALLVNKTPSTPGDPSQAVLVGLTELLKKSGIDPATVVEVVHGSTIGSNTILEKKGARVGLITTRGFRDVLEIGRIRTPDMFDLTWEKPIPLVERRHRLEVDERIGANGEVVTPLDPESVQAAGMRFAEEGIEAIAICFINSYRNPVHEEEAGRILRDLLPGVDITLSSAVLPEIKEYERTSTTVVNAYLLPIVRRYLSHLIGGLHETGVQAPLLMVASNGGVMGAEAAAKKPVMTAASGPAAGIVGAARLGRLTGYENLVVFDMGGTTAKASYVEGGQVTLTTEYEFREGISIPSRFIKAGGYMLKVPSVDVAEVGSGGGSIAHIDEGGLLGVGPQSAGADPGPVCYARGGDRTTVTDANVILGYLNPTYLAGGTLRLDSGAARTVLQRDFAAPLGLSAEEAAFGIREVVNSNMVRAIRSVTIERGRDPRQLALVAFGGSGPVHAVDLARAMGIPRVIFPVLPGVFCAVGMLASDVEHHYVRSHVVPLRESRPELTGAILDEMRNEALGMLAAEGYAEHETEVSMQADLRYLGQASELSIPISEGGLLPETFQELEQRFYAEYEAAYGYATQETVELVNLRLVGKGPRAEQFDFGALRLHSNGEDPAETTREVFFNRESGRLLTPVRALGSLDESPLPGPMIIDTYDSTLVVPPGWTARRDPFGNIIVEMTP